MARVTITRALNIRDPLATSVLETAATGLAAGQCVKLGTTLSQSTLVFGSEASDFIQWSASAVYDPTRKQVSFIGKRASSYPYHWLVYDEETNTWSNNRALWSSGTTSGHGYDHNALDPATGTHYFRQAGLTTVQSWAGSWAALPPMAAANVAGTLTWFPGVGLMYADGSKLQRYTGGAWATVVNYGGSQYHVTGEYNADANVMVFGGGNVYPSGSPMPMRKVTSALAVSLIAEPPFALGATQDQGLLVTAPGTGALLAYRRGVGTWAEYDIATDTWGSLSAAAGDGSSPAAGLPPLSTAFSWYSVIACPIEVYGVVMFIQYKGSLNADVWLYKHA